VKGFLECPFEIHEEVGVSCLGTAYYWLSRRTGEKKDRRVKREEQGVLKISKLTLEKLVLKNPLWMGNLGGSCREKLQKI